MPMPARILVVLTLAAVAGTAAARKDEFKPGKDDYSWTRTSDVGRNPVSKTTREQFDFSATGRVEVSQIGGSVRVRTAEGTAVAFEYERRAASQQDFDCETLEVERGPDEVRIRVVHKRERACRVVRAEDELTLTVPRGASVTVRDVGDEVEVSGVEGLVRLSDIGNSVTVTGAQQVDARDIGNTVELSVTRLGAAGIRITDIGNSVKLDLPETVDARVRIADVGNEIRGPGLRLRSDDDAYQAVLGQGGPDIRIDDVGNRVEIRGPRLVQPERDRVRSSSRDSYEM
ncbi:MAG: hypothetical protein ACT4PK_01215 [Gammaproteobacteria bacterium]